MQDYESFCLFRFISKVFWNSLGLPVYFQKLLKTTLADSAKYTLHRAEYLENWNNLRNSSRFGLHQRLLT